MRNGPSKFVVHALAAGISITAATAAVGESIGLRLNFSASLPRGLYREAETGRLAEFCQPGAGEYVMRGRCPSGAAPLLKPIIATEGQTVLLSRDGISVDGQPLRNTAPKLVDRNGRVLRHYPFGRYVVARGEVWVASTHHPGSFDSRYFGPIGEAEIRRRLKPVVATEVAR